MKPTGFDLLYKQICNPAKWGGKLQICLKTTINEWMRCQGLYVLHAFLTMQTRIFSFVKAPVLLTVFCIFVCTFESGGNRFSSHF
jgi:hypothetical protein